jgi:hypothetical protein
MGFQHTRSGGPDPFVRPSANDGFCMMKCPVCGLNHRLASVPDNSPHGSGCHIPGGMSAYFSRDISGLSESIGAISESCDLILA